MEKKKFFVCELAEFLTERGMTLTAPELAALLNHNGFRTEDGRLYEGEGRPGFPLIKAAYDWPRTLGMESGAGIVAMAFTTGDGSSAFEANPEDIAHRERLRSDLYKNETLKTIKTRLIEMIKK